MTTSLVTIDPAKLSSVQSFADLLRLDPELPEATEKYTQFLLLVAHFQLADELMPEIEAGTYTADPKESPEWLAMCHQRAYELTQKIEKLSLSARLELFVSFNDRAMFSELGYKTIEDWFTQEADGRKGGMASELRFIGTTLIPFCKEHELFDDPKALADWFRQPNHINRTRAVVRALREVIADVGRDPGERAENVSVILKAVEDSDTTYRDLRTIDSRGNKAQVTITKNGEGWYLDGHLDKRQLEGFMSRNKFAMVINFEDDEDNAISTEQRKEKPR